MTILPDNLSITIKHLKRNDLKIDVEEQVVEYGGVWNEAIGQAGQIQAFNSKTMGCTL